MVDNSIRVILGQSEKEYQLWKTIKTFFTCLDKRICYLYYYKFGLLYDNKNISKKNIVLFIMWL
jgi:hypothetical protein